MTGTMLDVGEVRHELMWTYLNVSVALQIRGLREKRGWSQEELAQRAGLHQEQISLLEMVRWKHHPQIGTLRAVAQALDVALKVQFESYGELVNEFMGTSEVPIPLSFSNDPAFAESREGKSE